MPRRVARHASPRRARGAFVGMFVVVFVLMAGLVLAGSAAVREPPLDRVGDGRGDVVARAGHPRHATTTAAPLVEEALPMPQAGGWP